MNQTDTPCYGTVEHYSEMFADIIADCSIGDKQKDLETIANVMAGFEDAIFKWIDYHETSIDSYRELHRRFILGILTDDA